MEERKPRKLTDAERDEILAIKSDDITIQLIVGYFAKKFRQEARFLVNDYFILPTDRFGTKREVFTTVGIYITNLHLIQPKFAKIFGYINEPFTGSVISRIENKLSDCLYYDEIATKDMADYYNRLQWLGGHDAMSFLSPTITPALIEAPTEILNKKKELFEKHKAELDESNPKNAIVASKIEKELIKDAEEYLKKQDGYENFASKSKININNNYKTMNIMKGPLLNSYTGKYRVNSSEYGSGIKKEEYASFADSGVIGSYSRAVETANGGYLAKKSNQANNTVMAGPAGSDCGTTKYLDVYIYPTMVNEYLNRYILGDDKKLIELVPENINQYVGTTVKMRSPLYCKMGEPCYCNTCLGNAPYKMNLQNFGLAMSTIQNKIMYKSMKKFHDLTVKTMKIDTDHLFFFNDK